jgi:pyruvate dehydrogenase E1 component beta subunit
LNYKEGVSEAMDWLAKKEKTVFLGEGIINAGRIYNTLDKVPLKKCIEMPIAENLIMGSATGLAIEGNRPIVIFQRMDFLTIASDQIINHLALIPKMSGGKIQLPVIIRTIIGSRCAKFDVGCQHNKDLTHMFSRFINVIEIKKGYNPLKAYKCAWELGSPVMVIEEKDLYE